jgi:hypothetical protein
MWRARPEPRGPRGAGASGIPETATWGDRRTQMSADLDPVGPGGTGSDGAEGLGFGNPLGLELTGDGR